MARSKAKTKKWLATKEGREWLEEKIAEKNASRPDPGPDPYPDAVKFPFDATINGVPWIYDKVDGKIVGHPK
jgi:hypothetical protein